jgi:hypothetical protein
MALWECGLLKFFKVQGMRAQLMLLEYLVCMWDVNEKSFHVGVHTLTLEIDEIYFFTGLSPHGSRVSLSGSRGSGEPMDYYVSHLCIDGTKKDSGNVSINDVQYFPLRTILYIITHMEGSVAPHMALQSHFQYVIECMEPRVFNCYKGLLKIMKKQLTKCRNGRLKQFGYGSILVSFFLERVPIFHLQHLEWGIPAPQDPRMKRWVDLMARHGGMPIISYDPSFFQWLRDQFFMVENYAYVRNEFHRDIDLSLPERSQWGEIGKKSIFLLIVVFGIMNIFF